MCTVYYSLWRPDRIHSPGTNNVVIPPCHCARYVWQIMASMEQFITYESEELHDKMVKPLPCVHEVVCSNLDYDFWFTNYFFFKNL